jgi:hypothetical protein
LQDEDSNHTQSSAASEDEPAAKKQCMSPSPSSSAVASPVKMVPVANRKYGQQKSDAKRGRARKSQSPSPSRDDEDDPKEVDEDEIPSSDEIERRATKSYK